MAKNDHAHSIRLTESIKRHIGNEAAEDFAKEYPLSKSAGIDKKYEWARNTCDFLETHYDLETIITIRKECRCNDGKSIANKLLQYLNKANNIEQFVHAFNEHETFATMEYISDHHIRFSYPQCYCACIKRVPGVLSKTWCYCTLGNAESIFKEVFKQDDIKVTLLESIKTGGNKCVMAVTWSSSKLPK